MLNLETSGSMSFVHIKSEGFAKLATKQLNQKE